MNISFHKESLEDVASMIFDLVKKTFIRKYDPPTNSVADVKNYLRNCEVYVVRDTEKMIGYFSFTNGSTEECELKSIALLPEYQGKGIGEKMIKQVVTLVNGRKIRLVVHPQNSSAVIAYLKSGFEIEGWRENYFNDNQPRLILRAG